MNSYRPSWYVPLHRAAKDIANQQDRQLREVELWLCEQVELGKVHVIFLDKHERECEIRRSNGAAEGWTQCSVACSTTTLPTGCPSS